MHHFRLLLQYYRVEYIVLGSICCNPVFTNYVYACFRIVQIIIITKNYIYFQFFFRFLQIRSLICENKVMGI